MPEITLSLSIPEGGQEAFKAVQVRNSSTVMHTMCVLLDPYFTTYIWYQGLTHNSPYFGSKDRDIISRANGAYLRHYLVRISLQK